MVVGHWNRLNRDVLKFLSLGIFKTLLDKDVADLIHYG